MCKKVKMLYDSFELIENSKSEMTKREYINALKNLRKELIKVACSLDPCTDKLNEVNQKIQFSICMN